jgi:tRNA threonylcarbamoyladenosine biosynthesis protein TsaB
MSGDTPTLLALDTSGPAGSVAVGRGGHVLARVVLTRRAEHAARLVPAIAEALATRGLAARDVEGVVVGEGPGSFTGVRVAAATAKGLARALGVPLWAVSSLAGTALACGGAPVRYALFDARQDRVYGACYRVADGVEVLVEPHAGVLTDALEQAPEGAVFVGDGAARHRASIEGAGFAVSDDDAPVVAEGLLAFLHARSPAPIADSAAWEPRYIRPWSPDAAWKGSA